MRTSPYGWFLYFSLSFIVGLVFAGMSPVYLYSAHAALIVTPTSGADGKFSVAHDAGYGLFTPVDFMDASTTYCTASSTPLTDDCDVSPSGLGGTWAVQDFATDTPSPLSSYNYLQSTTTADALWRSLYGELVDMINQSWAIPAIIFGIIVAILAFTGLSQGLVMGTRTALKKRVDRKRRR